MQSRVKEWLQSEWWHRLANRLYFSTVYSALYVVMIALNSVMIVWMLMTPGGYDGSLAFLALQIIVNLVLVLEVLIRLVSQKEKYFQQCSNVFDFFVMTLAIIAQILYIHPPAAAAAAITTEEWADIGATAFRILRDGILFARLFIFLKNRKKNKIPEEGIDFSTVNDQYPLLGTVDEDWQNGVLDSDEDVDDYYV
eukprot:TRINITY_DN67579_c6_g1_i4.p1 TRINITY_DN67579_c6_g1~~TRINITY_DN67579_c6_g1_i4.p1  ORF type:complete len:216 (-),score=97.04 TRINITY_DN67579_c6_g1_i4:191-778(-)